MAPGQLMILLHVHTTPNPLDEIFPKTTWRDKTLEMFLSDGLIDVVDNTIRTTPRGNAYIEAACTLPLPECKWVIPEEAA